MIVGPFVRGALFAMTPEGAARRFLRACAVRSHAHRTSAEQTREPVRIYPLIPAGRG